MTPGTPLGMYGYYSYPMYGYGYGASYFSPYGVGWLGDMYGDFGGYGLGFFPGYGDIGYDPFDPLSASVGLGYDPYVTTDPTFVAEGGGSYSSSVPESKKTGALRLHVKPDTASVYVDGNYVGLVNQYNGLFHKLHLDTGTHQVELRADGYQTLAFHVRVESGQVQAYRGELDKTNR